MLRRLGAVALCLAFGVPTVSPEPIRPGGVVSDRGGPLADPPPLPPSWNTPSGHTSAAAASERRLTVSPTLLDGVLPVVYGPAKVAGYGACCYVAEPYMWCSYFLSWGEQDSVTDVRIGEELCSDLVAADEPWLLAYEVHVGVLDPTLSAILSEIPDTGDGGHVEVYPSIARVDIKVDLYAASLPSQFALTAICGGRKVWNPWDPAQATFWHDNPTYAQALADRAEWAVSTNPAVIAHDVICSPTIWRGLADGVFPEDDWEWIADHAVEQVGGEDRYRYQAAIEERDPVSALTEVLGHIHCGYHMWNGQFRPIPNLPPAPVTGAWSATGSATLTEDSTAGAATTELAAGDRIFVDGHGALLTIVAVNSDDEIEVDDTVTVAAARVRPITPVHVYVEDWVEEPEGTDLEPASIPDRVVVGYTSQETWDRATVNCDDPAGYQAGYCRREEITMRGAGTAGVAARLGQVIRRTKKLAPFAWSGTASPVVADLLPGDIFTFDTDELSGQTASVDSIERLPSGAYVLAFIEYDFSVFSDDTADEDTPVSRGDPWARTPPDPPSSVNQQFTYYGDWDASSLLGDPDNLTGWTTSGMTLAYDAGNDCTTATPTATAAFLRKQAALDDYTTTPTHMLIGLVYRLHAGYDSVAVWQLRYMSESGGAPVVRRTVIITPASSGDTAWHLAVLTVPIYQSDTNHYVDLYQADTSGAPYMEMDFKRAFMVPFSGAVPSTLWIGQLLSWTEHANAGTTVDFYQAVRRVGNAFIVDAEVEQGETEMVIPMVGPFGQYRTDFEFRAKGPGGYTYFDVDTQTFHEEDSYARADELWDIDATGRAAGKAIIVGSDGITKEYVDSPTGLGADYLHGVLDRNMSTIAFDKTTQIFTLDEAIPATWFDIYYKGYLIRTSTIECDLNDFLGKAEEVQSGLWYIYFEDTTSALVASQTPWNLLEHVPIATVFWNGTEGAVSEERHGARRDLQWHAWAHLTVGTRYQSGLAMTAPSTGSYSTVDFSAGTIWDEDLEITIPQQTNCRVFYLTDASTYTWEDSNRAHLWSGAAVEYIDTDTYAKTALSGGQRINTWIYASTDVDRALYVFVEARSAPHSNTAAARAMTPPSLSGFGLTPELKLLYRCIWGATSLEEVTDYRQSASLPAGGTSPTAATNVTFAPVGDIAATNVQAALQELDDEKLPLAIPIESISSGAVLGTVPPLIVLVTNTTAITITSAADSSGAPYHIKNVGSGVVTISALGAETIDGAASYTLNPNEAVTLVSDETEWWVL